MIHVARSSQYKGRNGAWHNPGPGLRLLTHLPLYDEGKLGREGEVVAQPLECDGAEAVEDQQDDEEEQDGAGVQHDALGAVELHFGLRSTFLNGSKFLAKQF